jgi:hypothetical protein
VKKKLLNLKSIDKICANCAYGTHAPDGDSVLCEKRGVMLNISSCKKFKYDPLNRTPARHVLIDDHTWEEFVL